MWKMLICVGNPEVADYVEQSILKRQHAVGVFLDIKSALDSISPIHIYNSLIKFGADPDMALWYKNYLLHRNVIFELEGIKITKSIAIRFP